MDGTGVAPPSMPAELPEADDEIDIEGDDDVPLLHHQVHFSPHHSRALPSHEPYYVLERLSTHTQTLL